MNGVVLDQLCPRRAALKLLTTFATFTATHGLQCGYTKCTSLHDYCCVSTQYSIYPTCCSSLHTDWALRGTGIGFGITVTIIIFVAFCSCFRKYRRNRGDATNPQNSDLPPDYNSIKVSVEEPPPYYKLYPIPGAPSSGDNSQSPESASNLDESEVAGPSRPTTSPEPIPTQHNIEDSALPAYEEVKT
uniref:Uncharacterized protein LOC100179902 n=1 Tax=Phallusia mammillata TaxID=59560 RepID=A0A6F9DHU8_9ASCI|nr:uncharacterized protein LOC100179902 [Phallusia mammillata]